MPHVHPADIASLQRGSKGIEGISHDTIAALHTRFLENIYQDFGDLFCHCILPWG